MSLRLMIWSSFVTTLLAALVLLISCGSPGGARYASDVQREAGLAAPTAEAAMSAPTEELWIISRQDRTQSPDSLALRSDEAARAAEMAASFSLSRDDSAEPTVDMAAFSSVAGCGGIVGIPIDQPQQHIDVPLKHTDVSADIAAYIASVNVKQRFHNPYSGKIEAVYVFPLPQDAAVNEFIMTIGERRIRGIIREREEAERIYYEARRQGYVASLMTQQRPNIFTQRVANIEPGREIDVDITYFHTLPYDHGWYEFVFPMVVGPRYNPSGSADPVRALPRGSQPHGYGTDVTYVAPNERSGHDIALSVNLDAGVALEQLACNTHAIQVQQQHTGRAHVQLTPNDSIPNRDFVLRYRVAGDRIKTNVITQRDSARYGGSGHFTMMIYPPADLQRLQRQPVEFVFVLDCSGSMEGEPMDQAKQAVSRALSNMNENDTFQIVRFSDTASTFGSRPVPATRENLRAAEQYLRRLDAGGGTEMLNGIRTALGFPRDVYERQRYVVFLTDGYIGNEAEILETMNRELNGARIFSFGIGSSVNRFLMERMASLGNGTVAYVGLHDNAAAIMDQFFQRVAHPALTDIQIDFGGMRVSDVFPQRVPDLFVGRPITLAGRFDGAGDTTVRITGRAGGRTITMPIEVDMTNNHAMHDGIASVWARQKIAQLMDHAIVEGRPDTFAREIRHVALQYNLMSAYTSFVAVDSSQRTAGDHGTTVQVPVNVPEGVQYDTTVGK